MDKGYSGRGGYSMESARFVMGILMNLSADVEHGGQGYGGKSQEK